MKFRFIKMNAIVLSVLICIFSVSLPLFGNISAQAISETIEHKTAFQSIASGTYFNAVWNLDETGTLIVSGENCVVAWYPDEEALGLVPGWFDYMESIEHLVIDSGIIRIGGVPFTLLKNLKSIYISDTVAYIEPVAFFSNPSLEVIEVDENNAYYCGMGNCLIKKSNSAVVFGCKNSIIPDDCSIIRIDDYAFYECVGLTDITIPEGVEQIGYCAFNYCMSLKSVSLPESLKQLSSGAFSNCYSLKTINLPNQLIELSEEVFTYDFSLQEIIVPKKVAKIEFTAFEECFLLENILILNPDCQIEDTFDAYMALNNRNEETVEFAYKVYMAQLELYDKLSYLQIIDKVTVEEYQQYMGTLMMMDLAVSNLTAEDLIPLELVIEGFENSSAHTYAQINGFHFVPVTENATEHECSLQRIDKVPQTCIADGNISYYYCKHCDMCFADPDGLYCVQKADTVLPMLTDSHRVALTYNQASEPTCEEAGNVEYYHCSVCNKDFSDKNGENPLETVVIKPLGHSYRITKLRNPTCSNEGYYEYVCDRDSSHTYIEVREMISHTDVDEDGLCDVCATVVEKETKEYCCNHICHKNGFVGSIWKIINFFNELFRINQYCNCGAKHW